MTRKAESAFDVERYGRTEFEVIEYTATGSVSFTVSFASGLYSHTDISSVVSSVAQLGQQLESGINAASTTAGGAGDFSVSWDAYAGQYTISKATYTFDLDFSGYGADGVRMRRLLGYSGDKFGVTSAVSDFTPWFCLFDSDAQAIGYDADSYEYDPGDRASYAVALDGSTFAQGPSGIVRYRDLEWQAVERRIVFYDQKASADDFTFQELQTMASVELPVVLYDGSSGEPHLVCYLRPEGAFFTQDVRARFTPSSDLLWSLRWRLVLEGEVTP